MEPGLLPPRRRTLISDEVESKLVSMRSALEANDLGGLRLRGHDWFAWGTGGASNAVLLTSELGVAELLVTPTEALVLADTIDADRLRQEDLSTRFETIELPWAEPRRREAAVVERLGDGAVASDRPAPGERPLPEELAAARRRLHPTELERYRLLGREAAEAMTDTIASATPSATEWEIAGAGASALLRRGIDPALVLVGGARRLARYRHPTPTSEPLGDRAMVVFCARRHGLYANLTRFVSFCPPTSQERRLAGVVAEVEAAAWTSSRPGATLGEVYAAISTAYEGLGFAGAELGHHQGGVTGYRSRDLLAVPGSAATIRRGWAVAWNPSLPGSKIEDTAFVGELDLETLTVDPRWPTVSIHGRRRPDLLVLA